MDEDTIRYAVTDQVAVITLNCPQRAVVDVEGGASAPGDTGHGHREHGATLLSAADAALAIMNVSR